MKIKISLLNKFRENYIPITDIETIPMSYDESKINLNELILENLIEKHCNNFEKEVLTMFAIGFSLREIAETFGMKFSKIKSAYTTGIKKLRRYYEL